MDIGRLLKWIVVIALVVAGWKYGKPWVQKQFGGAQPVAVSGAEGTCVRSAEQASEAWGSGLRNFVNPPVDLNAWSSFRNGVDAKIQEAESDCACASESCTQAKAAMSDLRGLVADMDAAFRNNAPMDDMVQRQEAIDTKINVAGTLMRGGK